MDIDPSTSHFEQPPKSHKSGNINWPKKQQFKRFATNDSNTGSEFQELINIFQAIISKIYKERHQYHQTAEAEPQDVETEPTEHSEYLNFLRGNSVGVHKSDYSRER